MENEMPRLPVWFGGAALLGGGYYAFYYHFYTPRHTTRSEIEMAIEAERFKWQSVMQRYAILHQMVQKLRDSGTDVTNRERLYIYCELQKLREAFYNLSIRAQSASEKQAVLRDLDEVEVANCTVLNFRDEALTMGQILTCQLCFSLYVLCFCLIDPVLRRVHCEAVERVRRHGLHIISRWMMHRLRIPVTMTLENTLPRPDGDVNEVTKEDEEYIVFSPQHWIEVVGFWACPTNPLLTNIRVRWLLSCDVVPFEVHWRRRWQQMRQELRDSIVVEGNEEEEEEEKRRPVVQSSFGYPLASRLSCGGEMHDDTKSDHVLTTTDVHTPRFFPVVSTGMPRVLFVSDAVARRDVRTRRTLHEVYTNVLHRQFPVNHNVVKNNKADDRVKGYDATYEQLYAWRKHGGVPVWHRVEWGSVYGDVGSGGNRDRRELTFCMGRPCSAKELMVRQMELLQNLLLQTKSNGEEVSLL
ncbi:hypothetical protein MOQ_003850 [Trypanosoma cruzi marinkellei]|uniref:Uncharacterized protein n=1 Tax=Trypanosoma cruzi marinkellei TaxID=85056 RepID=K2NTK3_TRYCR|nr:hypothetical protein MOQ_003850 [Trypanosoma cruzi marinkellei]